MDDEGLAARIRAAFEEIPVPGREELLAVPARTGWRRAAGFVLAVSVAIAAGGFLLAAPWRWRRTSGSLDVPSATPGFHDHRPSGAGLWPGGVNGKSLGDWADRRGPASQCGGCARQHCRGVLY